MFSGTERKTEQYKNPDNDPRGAWTSANMVGLATADSRPNLHYDLINPNNGINYGCPNKGWRYDRKTMQRLIEENRILWPDTEQGRPRKKAFLNELSDNLPGFSSIFEDGIFTNTATKELLHLFDGHWFDFPKPSNLLKNIFEQVTSDNDIILDFFSGSGTTAHAVMQLNAEDGGNRKFICVQLPEVTDESSEAYKAGYKNICEIGKERIRRAGQKIASEQKADLFDQEGKKLDTGFKVFKLDTSNLKTWDSTPINSNDPTQIDLFMERLNGMIDTIKHDRTDTDMVYEVMLKMGISLTYPITEVEIYGKRAYSVGDNCLLLVCLQEGLTTETIEAMAADYLPSKLVLSEKCFADDTAMANAHYILKERDIELKLV